MGYVGRHMATTTVSCEDQRQVDSQPEEVANDEDEAANDNETDIQAQ